MIKTLIFDLGNVIISFDHNRIVQQIEKYCPYKSDEIYQRILTSSITQDYNLGKISSLEFFDAVKNQLNLQIEFAEFSNIWNSTFDLKPILSEQMFKKLSETYRLMLLSDTNELHFEFIRQNFPILNYFDNFVLSYQLGVLKPSPEIFLAAVKKAGCLPEECFFTDDVKGNVEGAQKAGIKAFHFVSAQEFEKEVFSL